MLNLISKMTAPPGRWQFLEVLTQQGFMANTYEHLVEQVQRHRKAVNSGSDRHGMKLDLDEGWQKRLEHEVCLHLPEGLCQDPENPEPYRTELQKRGRKLWKELHDYALNYPESPSAADVKSAQEWFRLWRLQIPNFGKCACQKHFQDILTANPVRFQSRASFYEWSVEVHNSVNSLLSKPLWTPSG